MAGAPLNARPLYGSKLQFGPVREIFYFFVAENPMLEKAKMGGGLYNNILVNIEVSK